MSITDHKFQPATTEYHERLARQVESPDQWPELRAREFLELLENTVNDAIDRDSFEGYLAAFLVYQQTTEEYIKVLITWGRLYVQCATFPSVIKYSEIDDLTFGNLIHLIDEMPYDNNDMKEELKNNCRELNKIRIQIVHKLSRKRNFDDIKKGSMRARRISDTIFYLSLEMEMGFRLFIADYQENHVQEWRKNNADLFYSPSSDKDLLI